MRDQLERTAQDVARVARWSREQRREAALRLLKALPLFDIEASSACNDDCPFCPRAALTRPQELMTPETFQAVERFLPGNAVVMFSGLGEPLLNPHLPDFVARLKRRGVSSCVVTNGLLLTSDLADALVDAGLDQFQVSVRDLAFPVARMARITANLEHLKDHRRPGLRCQLNVVLSDEASSCPQAAEALASRLGFSIFVRRRHSRGGADSDRRSRRPDDGCGIFAAVTMITAQGGILACTNDLAGSTEMGHVATCNWPEVLTKKAAALATGASFAPCNGCDDDYRWVILANAGVDVKQDAGMTHDTSG